MLSNLFAILLFSSLAVAKPAPKPLAMPVPEPAPKPAAEHLATHAVIKAADGSYLETALKHHNWHRQNHSAVALKWSHKLALDARALAKKCVFEHNTNIGGGGYGQNIAAGWRASEISGVITDGWYNSEVTHYLPKWYGHEPDLSTFESYGHFTQVVWAGSREVGCFTHNCSSVGGLKDLPGVSPYFTVCNYAPSGNWVGEFAANVKRSKGEPSIGPNHQ